MKILWLLLKLFFSQEPHASIIVIRYAISLIENLLNNSLEPLAYTNLSQHAIQLYANYPWAKGIRVCSNEGAYPWVGCMIMINKD